VGHAIGRPTAVLVPSACQTPAHLQHPPGMRQGYWQCLLAACLPHARRKSAWLTCGWYAVAGSAGRSDAGPLPGGLVAGPGHAQHRQLGLPGGGIAPYPRVRAVPDDMHRAGVDADVHCLCHCVIVSG